MKTAEVIDIHTKQPIASEQTPGSDYKSKVERTVISDIASLPDATPDMHSDIQNARWFAAIVAKHMPERAQTQNK